MLNWISVTQQYLKLFNSVQIKLLELDSVGIRVAILFSVERYKKLRALSDKAWTRTNTIL